ncbi:V-type ATP synthase subunit A, partial [Streptomyces sp. GC420]|uniref:V-type ATP synthase subunit A n=1 Tax=Streptomyces sp. GC420 TaxID=2697568 RepID=UPI0014150D4F
MDTDTLTNASANARPVASEAPGPAAPRPAGRILRVAGPLVEARCPEGTAMYDLIALGEAGLPGEIVAISQDIVTAQAYEYTGGLAPGEPARPLGMPLSARLGPGLLGGIFDGLLRPLVGAPDWLAPGARVEHAVREWDFTPTVEEGATVTEGQPLGDIGGAGPVALRVLVPPGRAGRVERISLPGRYTEDTVVAVVGGTDVRMSSEWPVRRPRPVRGRTEMQGPLNTGQRAIDLLFPVALGSTVAVPGGFGTGKTVLLQQIAKWCDADVIVYVGCGERGNEMADVIDEFSALEDPRTGGRLAERTVTVANTSNMPMMAREASIHTGVTVAEYFRDMGLDVVVIADSTSRWAEALREFASRTGALPAEEGYPAGLASSIAAFYERAGTVTTLGGGRGSVTVIGAVSPPGGDMAEPVTSHTQRFVRCLWTLDRELAYARHYPAVSWAESFSRDARALGEWRAASGDPGWAGRRARVAELLAEAGRLADLVDLVGITALPDQERISVLGGRLVREGLLQQSALSEQDAYSAPEKTAALADAVLETVDRCRDMVRAGTLAADIEEMDFGPLLRAREDAGPRDAARVESARARMLTALRRGTATARHDTLHGTPDAGPPAPGTDAGPAPEATWSGAGTGGEPAGGTGRTGSGPPRAGALAATATATATAVAVAGRDAGPVPGPGGSGGPVPGPGGTMRHEPEATAEPAGSGRPGAGPPQADSRGDAGSPAPGTHVPSGLRAGPGAPGGAPGPGGDPGRAAASHRVASGREQGAQTGAARAVEA